MNHRDRNFIIKELKNWGLWVRQGRTLPNALGFKRRTVEYGIFRGDLGGEHMAGSIVPTWFNIDRLPEKIDSIVIRLPNIQLCAVSGIYVRGLEQTRTAEILGVTRGKLRNELNKAYSHIYQGID